MSILKRIFFSIPFLICFIIFNNYLSIFLENTNNILSLNLTVYLQTLYLALFLILSGFFLIIFITLAEKWFLVIPVITIASVSSFLSYTPPIVYIMLIGSIISFLIIYITLLNKLKTYLSFSPTIILVPSIKHLVILLILISSISFYLIESSRIKANGFTIPTSILNQELNLVNSQLNQGVGQNNLNSIPQISAQNLQILKNNPQALKQFGINPDIINNFIQNGAVNINTQSVPQSFTKNLIENQMNAFIRPYLKFIAPVLTLLFFLTLTSFTSLLELLLTPLVGTCFWILEKIHFTSYQIEMREVKKLIT